jgi:hypothetical protein
MEAVMSYDVYKIYLKRQLRDKKTDAVVLDYSKTTPFFLPSVPCVADKTASTGTFKRGEFKITSYHNGRIDSYTSKEGGRLVSITPNGPSYYWYYEFNGPIPALLAHSVPVAIPTIDTDNSATMYTLNKARAKVGASAFGGGEQLGEIRETLELFRHPLSSLDNFLSAKNLRLLKDAYAKRHTPWALIGKTGKTAASVWMEIRYGLRPILYSIADAVELLDKKERAFDPNRIRHKAAVKQISRVITTNVTGGNSVSLLVEGRQSVRYEQKVRSTVYYKQAAPFSSSKNWGIHPRYWPETAWDLTRLSFVIDWIVDVGSWLGAHRIQPDITILGATTSYKTEVDGNIYVSHYSGSYVGTKVKSDFLGANVAIKGTWYDRKVVSADPSRFPAMRWAAGLDLLSLVDALAISFQLLAGKLRSKSI